MVDKQLNQSLEEIIQADRISKVHTTKKIITTFNPTQQNFRVQRKVITKPFPRTFTRKSPKPEISPIKQQQQQQQYYTSAVSKEPIKKNPKQFFTEKYYKEQLALQQQKEQQELAEKAARQQRIQQISQMQQKARQSMKRIKIENLHHSINHQELRELFEACGELAKLGIVWDELGYSTGTAIVEYKTEEGAKKAIKEYNEAELDGLILQVTNCETL